MPEVWRRLMTNSPPKQRFEQTRKQPPRKPVRQNNGAQKPVKKNWFKQMAVLLARNLHILINDRVRLMLILLQAPLLSALISFVADGEQFNQLEMTKSLLFAMSCSAFWVGILNSIQEICKERVILRREYMTGMRLTAYITSKLMTMAIMCAVQTILLTGVFVVLVGKPDEGIVTHPVIELMLITFLTAMGASAMGIFVSSLFKNADRAMTDAPVVVLRTYL